MSGNVYEWCWGDPIFDGRRVIRGGGCTSPAGWSEVDYEGYSGPKYQDSVIGIRIVCSDQ